MAVAAPVRVFISHSHDEKELALAWRDLVRATTAGVVKVWLSTDTNPGGGMPIGEEWRESLYRNLREATHVFAVVSSRSLNRPWVVWEAGVATGIAKERKLVPLVFSMPIGELSGPISSYQAYGAEDRDTVKEVCYRLSRDAGQDPDISIWDAPIERYLAQVARFRPPRAASPEDLEAWRLRFTTLRDQGREAEVPQLAEQFYASLETDPAAVDRRIHELLSDVYLRLRRPEKALEELERALAFAPQDLILAHRKGLSLLEMKNLQAAQRHLEELYTRVPKARDWAEFAGLEGRLHRELYRLDARPEDIRRAAEAYSRAFWADPTQHYPGGQAIAMALLAGDRVTIDALLPKVLELCRTEVASAKASFWSDFTLGEMLLIQGDLKAATAAYEQGLTREPSPSPRERQSALQGVRRTAGRLNVDASTIEGLLEHASDL